jgi:hypothetical protein
MDLFHWNSESDFGDDQLFSVQTSAEAGYFLPELIADGEGMIDTASRLPGGLGGRPSLFDTLGNRAISPLVKGLV